MSTQTNPISSYHELPENNEIAVRVEGVSKSYPLWSSPTGPLAHSMSQLAYSLTKPFPNLQNKLEIHSQNLRHDFHALRDINFEIKKGESWGFIGVNGSGKSTLLKMISGNLAPTKGRIEVDGKVAILDYSSGLQSNFSGRENIYLKGTILGLTRREIDKKYASITEFADIGNFIDQPVKTYSSGMSARLGFAILAHVDADILITDEALAVGDAAFVQKCMRYIHKFLEHGTFLFVTHAINDVMGLCNKALWLEHGAMRMIGSARDVCLAYTAGVEQEIAKNYIATQSRLLDAKKLTGEELALLRQHARVPVSESSLNRRTAAYQVDEKLNKSDAMFDVAEGTGGGRILTVQLLDAQGRPLDAIKGGEAVTLRIHVVAESTVQFPIVGFQLMNSLGLTLFADNTSDITRTDSIELARGETLEVDFSFRVPLLPMGDYAFRVGFTNGTESNNAMMDIRHEALIIQCVASSIRHGLVGMPMLGISMQKKPSTI